MNDDFDFLDDLRYLAWRGVVVLAAAFSVFIAGCLLLSFASLFGIYLGG